MTLFDPAWLIHIGTAILLVGYTIRDELKLRIMIIAASVAFNLYYWLVPSPPLWDSVLTGILLISVNIYVLAQVLLERTTFRMSDDEKRLYEAFDTLNPGQFRRILKIADWHKGAKAHSIVLTREAELTSKLYYILDGTVSVEKGEYKFGLPAQNFLGEVAFVLNGQATATAIAPAGLRYVTWDAAELKKMGRKYPALGNALNALLTRDLAKKLTESYRPEDAISVEPA